MPTQKPSNQQEMPTKNPSNQNKMFTENTLKAQQKGPDHFLSDSHTTTNPDLNRAASNLQIEISLCKFHQPFGASESKDCANTNIHNFFYLKKKFINDLFF